MILLLLRAVDELVPPFAIANVPVLTLDAGIFVNVLDAPLRDLFVRVCGVFNSTTVSDASGNVTMRFAVTGKVRVVVVPVVAPDRSYARTFDVSVGSTKLVIADGITWDITTRLLLFAFSFLNGKENYKLEFSQRENSVLGKKLSVHPIR
jgi:hypothetical protein